MDFFVGLKPRVLLTSSVISDDAIVYVVLSSNQLLSLSRRRYNRPLLPLSLLAQLQVITRTQMIPIT